MLLVRSKRGTGTTRTRIRIKIRIKTKTLLKAKTNKTTTENRRMIIAIGETIHNIQISTLCITAVAAMTTFHEVGGTIPTSLLIIAMAHHPHIPTSMILTIDTMTSMTAGRIKDRAGATTETVEWKIEMTTIMNVDIPRPGEEVPVMTRIAIAVAIVLVGGTAHVHPVVTAVVVFRADVDDGVVRVRENDDRTLGVKGEDGALTVKVEIEDGTVHL